MHVTKPRATGGDGGAEGRDQRPGKNSGQCGQRAKGKVVSVTGEGEEQRSEVSEREARGQSEALGAKG
jgi:hypothetical protein